MLNKCDQLSRSNLPTLVWIFLLLIRHQTEINHCPSQKGKSHVLGTWILLMEMLNLSFWCCCWGYCWLVDNFFLIQVQVYFVDVHCVFLAQKRWSTEEVKWKKINKNCEISLAGTISQLFAQIALEGFPRLNWICPSQGCFVFYIVRTWYYHLVLLGKDDFLTLHFPVRCKKDCSPITFLCHLQNLLREPAKYYLPDFSHWGDTPATPPPP